MTEEIKSTTPGQWIVNQKPGEEFCEVVTVSPDPGNDNLVALVPNIADAALISISKDMLDVILCIQETLNSSKEVIDLEALNEMIEEVINKLGNEAGEERQ